MVSGIMLVSNARGVGLLESYVRQKLLFLSSGCGVVWLCWYEMYVAGWIVELWE